jgi:hypothetical protein
VGDRHQIIPLEAMDRDVISVAEPCSTCRQLVERRLQLRRRAADHAQDLAHGGFLLQRLGQLAGARFELPPGLRKPSRQLVNLDLQHRDFIGGRSSPEDSQILSPESRSPQYHK